MANDTKHRPGFMAISNKPETFDLVRLHDETGISGTGKVAEGVVFMDGTTALRWLTKHRSTVVYESAREVLAIHGHGGKTEIRYHVEKDQDGRACSNCAHPMSGHWMDGAAICACGGCSCCLMEHPEFKALGSPKDPRNFLGDTTPEV